MQLTNLKDMFGEDTDPDIARYFLACCLGLTSFDGTFDQYREHKGIFWTPNKVSSMLDEVLSVLVTNGVLEYDLEQSVYRWNSEFEFKKLGTEN